MSTIRFTLRASDEWVDLLASLATMHGTTKAAFLRHVVRQRAKAIRADAVAAGLVDPDPLQGKIEAAYSMNVARLIDLLGEKDNELIREESRPDGQLLRGLQTIQNIDPNFCT